VDRAQWGARQAKAINPLYASEGIYLHHTVTGSGPDEAAIVRQVQSYHMDTQGWNDIAYSWLVGQSGRIYMGRGWGVTGGHTEGWNSRSHAVCFIGNSDNDFPSDAAKRSINEVIAEHQRRYGGWVRLHKDVNATGCPGRHVAEWVAAGRPVTGGFAAVEDDMTPEQAEQLRNVVNAVADTQARVADVQGWVKNGITQLLARPTAGGTVDVPALAKAIVAAGVGRAVVDALAAELKD
jgi:hypothetical protein